MTCATSDSEKQEEELYEVAANYDDFGIVVSAKKPADANLVQAKSVNARG